MRGETGGGAVRAVSRTGTRDAVVTVALVAAVLAVYLPALGAGFIWDDDDYVTENATLRDLDGLRRIWFEIGAVPQYYPLVHTSFWLEYRLWGLHPAGFHAVNVVLHALNALLLWRVLRRLELPGAWLAAAVFALHPVHVESVAWITERKNVLSGAFYLAAALAWLRWRPPAAAARDKHGAGGYAAVVLLFAAALLSKSITATLPAVLLVVAWWKRGRLDWRDIRPTLPLFALGAASGLLTAWMERTHVGAVGADWSLTLPERAIVAGRAAWFYLGKLAWPHPLIFVYPRWTIDAGAVVGWLFPASAAALLGTLWSLRRRIGRAPLAAALVFGITLGPALGFLNVYPMRFSYVADHFQYLASIGPIALAVGCAARWAALGGPGVVRATATAALAGLALLATMTWRQSGVYRDAETLWRETLARNPEAHIAHNNLGGLLLARSLAYPGDDPSLAREAEGHFRRAAAIDYPEAHNNLGIVLHAAGRIDEAIGHYRRALALRPGFADAENNLGISLAALGRTEEALAHFERAVDVAPDFANARFNLGLSRLGQGRIGEAIEQFERAATLAPGDADVRLALGRALSAAGRRDEAIARFREVLALRPGDPQAARELAAAGVPARRGERPR